MAIKYNQPTNDAERVADIIITFSIVDDALCEYILNFPRPDKICAEMQLKLAQDRPNIGIGDKIDFLVAHFPNLPDPDGKVMKNLKSDLAIMKRIRNEIAHNRRFSMEDGILQVFDKSDFRHIKTRPLSKLSLEFDKAFKKCNSLFKAIYAYSWDYRNAYLYGEGSIYG